MQETIIKTHTTHEAREAQAASAATDRRIVIDANPYRTRAVLIENGRAVEAYSESSGRLGLLGNIFRGRVRSVLPGMSAAFIDIGEEKNAFLSLSDVRGVEGAKGQLRVGQELMVQVIKEPIGTKAARVGTQITLTGHFLVLLPTERRFGVSKSITDDAERARLRELLSTCVEPGMGAVARTAADGRSDDELIFELRALTEKWHELLNSYKSASAPRLIYHESGLAERFIRDLVRPDIARISVNDAGCCAHIHAICEELEPELCSRIVLHENEPNLFEVLGIEKQLDDALSRRVHLKSGAYIVIDHTEALVCIDVNSGKNIGSGGGLEKTALATNLEAAAEIARQLRLRDIGGIVIIDFIDMDSSEAKQAVLDALRENAKRDRAKVVVYDMTALGLVELARRKLRDSLSSSLQCACPLCDGAGRIASAETVALRIRARLLSRMLSDGLKRAQITARPPVVKLIRKHLADELESLGLDGIEINLVESNSIGVSEFDIRFLRD